MKAKANWRDLAVLVTTLLCQGEDLLLSEYLVWNIHDSK